MKIDKINVQPAVAVLVCLLAFATTLFLPEMWDWTSSSVAEFVTPEDKSIGLWVLRRWSATCQFIVGSSAARSISGGLAVAYVLSDICFKVLLWAKVPQLLWRTTSRALDWVISYLRRR